MRRWVYAILFWSVAIHCNCSCGTVIKENEAKKESNVKWQASVEQAQVESSAKQKNEKRSKDSVTEWLRADGSVRKRQLSKTASSAESKLQAELKSSSTASGSVKLESTEESSSKEVKQDPWRNLKLWGLLLLFLAILFLWAWWSIRTWLGKSFLPWTRKD